MKKEYFGFGLKQREKSELITFAFYAKAKDIQTWTGIRRNRDVAKGHQRVLVPSRVKAIKRFLSSDTHNIIPGSILVAFREGKAILENLTSNLLPCLDAGFFLNSCDDLVFPAKLSFTFDGSVAEQDRPAMIVDGQHRLYGLAEFDQEDIPILVTALVDASETEQAFQFVVINNKASRVPTTDVKSVIADIDEAELLERLLKAGIRYGDSSPTLRDINDLLESPFYKLLEWNYNIRQGGTPLVQLTAIEQSLKYIQSLFENTLPGRYQEGDDELLIQIFFALWNGVKRKYPNLWGKENKLMSKVAINALNELLADKLKFAWEFGLVNIFYDDDDKVDNFINERLEPMTVEFWEADWSIKIQDNANIKKLIKGDLEAMADNKRMGKPWRKDLRLPIISDIQE